VHWAISSESHRLSRVTWSLLLLLLLAGCRPDRPAPPSGSLDLLPLARVEGGSAVVLTLELKQSPELLGAGWVHRPGDDQATSADRHASLRLPLCPVDEGIVVLRLELRDPGPQGTDGRAGLIITFNGRKLTRLHPGGTWSVHRLELSSSWFRQGFNELVLTGQPGRSAVRSLQLELPGPRAHVSAGDTTRRSLIAPVPLVLDLPDPLQAGAILELSLRSGSNYRLEGWRSGRWMALMETSAGPEESWAQRTIPLDQDVTRLRLSATGPLPAWGPLLLHWPTPSSGGPNLILILADTLRADRLGAGGSAERLTPCLDALAAESVHFRDTLAQAPSTVPSVSSFFTGRYFNRLTHSLDHRRLPLSLTLFAEQLAAGGCRTLAVVTNPLLLPETGFARGFDEYHHLPGMARRFHGGAEFPVHRDAGAVNQRFLERLPTLANGRFFAYLHYMDPHDPYGLEEGEPQQFRDGRLAGLPWEGWLGPATGEILEHGRSSLVGADREMLARAYDHGVRRFDRHLGLLLAHLRRKGLLENTVVALVADHGEEFFEHGLLGHGHTVHGELLRVPVLVRFPARDDFPRPLSVGRRVELLDVAATLLDTMGAGLPEGHAGTSLMPYLLADVPDTGAGERFFETRHRSWVKPPLNDHLAGMETDGWKMTRDRRSGEVRLYNLHHDPGETVDLSARHPEQIEQLGRRLDAWLERQTPLEPEDEGEAMVGGEVESRERQALQALGYMQ